MEDNPVSKVELGKPLSERTQKNRPIRPERAKYKTSNEFKEAIHFYSREQDSYINYIENNKSCDDCGTKPDGLALCTECKYYEFNNNVGLDYWSSRSSKEVTELKEALKGIISCIENPLTGYEESIEYAHKTAISAIKEDMYKCLSCPNIITVGEYCTECSDAIDGRKQQEENKPNPKCLQCRGTGFRTVWDGSTGNDVIECECSEKQQDSSDDIETDFNKVSLNSITEEEHKFGDAHDGMTNKLFNVGFHRGYITATKKANAEIEELNICFQQTMDDYVKAKIRIKELEEQVKGLKK